MIVAATQALTQRPLFGHGADAHYDAPLAEITQAVVAVEAMTNAPGTINTARIEIVQAKVAMVAVTAH